MAVLFKQVLKKPIKALGLMNVWTLLPISKVMLASIYITRSVLLPTTHASTGPFVDQGFVRFVEKHLGVRVVRWSFLAPLYGLFTVFRYSPVMPLFRKLRNKWYTKSAVKAGKMKGVVLPPNTKFYRAGELLRLYAQGNSKLPKIKTVYQQATGDGGYGTLIYTPGKTPVSELMSLLRSVSASSYIIVADFAKDLTHTVGVPITPYGTIYPNANMSFTDSADTVGVSAPMMDVLKRKPWVNAAMHAAENVRKYILSHNIWSFLTMNVDLGIANHGSNATYFFEINPRLTMSHLVTSGIWKACIHKGTTKLDYYTFLEYMNSGRLNMAYIAMDKIACGTRTFDQIAECLLSAGLSPFNGHTGWLPTRQPYHGQIGLIFISKSTNAETALHNVKNMYLKALHALGAHTKGELQNLGI